VKLDVYRSCSSAEKRDVLNTFWHTNVSASPRIHQAATEYGPYAALCLVAMALELAFVISFSLHRAVIIGAFAVLFEALVVLSLGWSLFRWRELKGPTSP
jgi:hypothetical protein